MDLFIELNKQLKIPLYEQLYEGIKDAILTQQLTKHTKIPSKRQLADFLSISQTTVELAYNQLLAEGYIMSEPRVGFFVEDIVELPYIEKKLLPSTPISFTDEPIYTYNFSPSVIDEYSFPFAIWRKYTKQIIDEQNNFLLQTGHPQGEIVLRKEIAHYLYYSRGINCTPEQIIIGSGTEHLLPMILHLLNQQTALAVENPGYSALPIHDKRNKIIPVDVDRDGVIIKQLEQTEANTIYITPAHQFPTGAVLSAARRAQLLKWANKAPDRYIIEDDYDSEFRYVGKPIAALQSIDHNDKVIYLSTFTKALMPSLRVAYFVLPKSLLASYQNNLSYYSSTVPRFEQHILASFMKNGDFAKHLNKMRKIYRKKHDSLITYLQTYYPQIQIDGAAAGMHFIIRFKSSLNASELILRARHANIYIRPVSDYMRNQMPLKHPAFLLGFGGLKLETLELAIDALMEAFEQKKKANDI